MDTSESIRARVLAEAVIKLGLEHVATRLRLTQWELLQYAKGHLPMPPSIWAQVLHPDSGLIYDSAKKRSERLSSSGLTPLKDEPGDQPTQQGYTPDQPENYQGATLHSEKGRNSPA